MLYNFILIGIIGVTLIAFCELLINLKVIKGELARKIVHIVIAVFASTWAYFLTSTLILLICFILICVVYIVKKYKILRSFRAVNRVTYGEVWFPLGIGISALMFPNPDIYALAVLNMGLADGMAAVVGVKLGKKAGNFKINKSTKSIAGTTTFVAISTGLYLFYWLSIDNLQIFSNSVVLAFVISISSAIIVASVELISPKGSDNISVPVIAGILAVLPSLQVII
jgi:dolichol kinase